MNINDVILGSVDDYILQEKREGKKEINWTKDKYKLLLGVFALLRDKSKDTPTSIEFMGIKHNLIYDKSK